MTSAPANLLAVRSLLLTYLNIDKDAVRDADLEPAEVGIVGDPSHRGGYHCGSDRTVANDYSVVESPRDRAGLSSHASALDFGTFSVRSGGQVHTLRTFSVWLVAQCAANTADTRDIREIIYSPDGRTVRRWDRLGRRTDGDSSHLFHTHASFFRDSTKAGRDQTPVFRRYLTAIGRIAPTEPENTMSEQDAIAGLETVRPYQASGPRGRLKSPTAFPPKGWADMSPRMLLEYLFEGSLSHGAELRAARMRDEAILAKLDGQSARDILARIDKAAAADAARHAELVGRIGAQHAELVELVERLGRGEIAVDEFVRVMGERLAAGTPAAG
ncbi:hypothetical protein [Micromonospora sp. RP3T]|uniref:hypothetical protein n=1 Tax=Micromonospora sp. RP3T TaxID=2135446 RepID=UPI003D70C00A